MIQKKRLKGKFKQITLKARNIEEQTNMKDLGRHSNLKWKNKTHNSLN